LSKELTGYRFLDKDPSVDTYREALRKSGLSEDEALQLINDLGGPTIHTLRQWDKGKTRKPQHLSMAYAMMALGYHEQWVNHDTGDVLRSKFKDFPVSARVINLQDAALKRSAPRKAAKG